MNASRQDLPAPVCDPALRPAEQRVLGTAARAIGKAVTAGRDIGPVSDRMLIAYVLVASGAAAAQALLPGFPWAWAVFTGCVLALAGAGGLAGRFALRRYRGRYVTAAGLDRQSRRLLARAQAAIAEVRASGIFQAGLLPGAAELPEREWDLACRLRDLSAAVRAGARGTEPGREAIREVSAYAVRRVGELEEYAARVRAADARYRAWLASGGPDEDLMSMRAAAASDASAASGAAGLLLEADAVSEYFGPAGPPGAHG